MRGPGVSPVAGLKSREAYKSMSDTAERVKKIVIEHLGVEADKVVEAANFIDDLGADSLDTVELIIAFEEEFKEELKGEIPESDAERLQTVGQVIDYIKAKAGAA